VLTFTVAVAFLVAACSSDDSYSRAPTPNTGNEPIDEIITAMLVRDTDTVLKYWNGRPAPCFPEDEIGLPKCRRGEPKGTLVDEGAFRCGEGFIQLKEEPIGVADDWDLYSVQLDDDRGLLYRIIFSRRGGDNEPAVELIIRTAKPGLEDVFPFDFFSYSETCKTAAEELAYKGGFCSARCEIIIPPPDQRRPGGTPESA
jgi:hypothetical protein